MAAGLVASVAEATRLVLAARVTVDGSVCTQASFAVGEDQQLALVARQRYVSRGGLKLEGALVDFGLTKAVAGRYCLDAGASTGGFTHCLLLHGAAQVCAVDVGYGQFDWQLRQDARVRLFERTNIAKAKLETLGAPFEILTADLSFTSLARLALPLATLLQEGGEALALVKPQFELSKAFVRQGVVSDKEQHALAAQQVLVAFADAGLAPRAFTFSHLKGPKGNLEFWIWARKGGETATITVEEVVGRAHEWFLSGSARSCPATEPLEPE